jgi:hypothetical protein
VSTLRVFALGSGDHISHAIILHTKFSKYLLTRYFLHRIDINLHLVSGCCCGVGGDGYITIIIIIIIIMPVTVNIRLRIYFEPTHRVKCWFE